MVLFQRKGRGSRGRMKVIPGYYRVLLKYPVYILFIIVNACTHRSNIESGVTSLPSPERHFIVDSLVQRISGDTLSLLNWLKLNETTDDFYERSILYHQLGVYHQNNYSLHRAIEYHILSLQAATITNDETLIIRLLNALGWDYKLLCDYGESADYYFKSLALLDEHEGGKLLVEIEKINTLQGLGSLYLALNQTDEAMNYFKRSLEYAKRRGRVEAIIECLVGIGSVHEQRMEYDSAYIYYNQSLQYSIESNSVSDMSRGFERIGTIFRLKGDLESAMIYTTSAYQSLLDTSDKLNWLNACFSLASLNIQQGDFPEARKLLHDGITVANRLHLPSYQERAHLLYSEFYQQQGLAEKALEERALSDRYALDFRNEKNLNAVLRNRINYEKRSGEAEKNEILQQFRLKEKKVYYALLGNLLIIIGLLAFIFMLIQNYRLRKRNGLALLQMERLKTAFCARASQEFKNPVSIIIGMIERIKDDLALDERKKNHVTIDILSRQTESLYMLADEVASIANLQGTGKSSDTKNGNVVAYLQYLYECFAVLAENKRVAYTFHSDVTELFTNYKPDYLRAILNNLLDNAMKHCTENDQVEVRVTRDKIKKNYSLEIAHTGNIPTEDGMAIGLSLAKHLTEKIGGWIESTKNTRGETMLSATFPLPDTARLGIENPITIRRIPIDTRLCIEHGFHGNQHSIEKSTVLIVQENKYLAYYLTTLLQGKFQIILVTNGDDAFRSANEKRPDLIISDTKLPYSNGFELCKKIKGSALLGHVPVILLTSTGTRTERVKGFNSGADACLEKPLHEDEFMAVINQLLSSRKQIRDTYTRVIDINEVNAPIDIGNEENVDFLERITNAIYKNIANTDNIIEKLSSEMCLSTSQLNRRIKALTGMTTTNYILKTRLNRAKKQLIASQKPIGDIAMQCGFNDFAYFSRSFKREFGMTPTTFQRLPVSAG